MSDSGALYACGENNDNRLGLTEDSWTSWFTYEPADDDHKVLTPTKIKGIKQRIIDVAMAPYHTVCLTEHGKVVTMGRNIEAQLGRGHTEFNTGASKPQLVKSIKDKEVTLISAGSTFTVVGTSENVMYFWGTRFFKDHTSFFNGSSNSSNMCPTPQLHNRPTTKDLLNTSFGTRLATPLDKPLSESEVHSMLQLESQRRNLDSPLMSEASGVSAGFHQIPSDDSGSSSTAGFLAGSNRYADGSMVTMSASGADMFMMHHRHRSEITMRDVVLDPTEILALYASPKSLQRGETIMLRDIKCQNQVCTIFFHAL